MKKIVAGIFLIGLFILSSQVHAQTTQVDLSGSAGAICSQDATIDLTITDVTNLQGYDIRLSYNPASVSASMVFDNSFFDTVGAFVVPGSGCSAGVCIIGAAKIGQNTAVSSSGTETLATITLQNVASTGDTLDFTYSKLSDPDGFEIEHSLSSGVSIPSCPTAIGLNESSVESADSKINSPLFLFIILLLGLSIFSIGKFKLSGSQ